MDFSARLSQFVWLPLSMLMVATAAPVSAQVEPQSGLLQPNDQGGAVADLQQRLADLGYYSGSITGYFDAATQEAVSQFQQANGLAVDGIVGAATSSALNSTADSSADSVQSSVQSGGDVSGLQRQLVQLGYYNGAITGVFDSETQAAVISFQRDHGLAVDGIVGSATEAALAQMTSSASSAGTATQNAATTYTPTSTDGLLQLGDVGAEVSNLQSQLQALGYYDGPISGSFGSQTQVALLAFQQAQGLTADGIAGPRVTAALSTATAQPTVTQPTVTQPTVQPTVTQPSVITPVQPAPVQPATVPPTVQPAQPVMQQPMQPTQPAQPSPATVQVPTLPAPSQTAQTSLPTANPNRLPHPSSGDSRFGVSELQRRLQTRGFNPGSTTGVYDAATQNAITQAQEAYDLDPSDLSSY